MGGTKGIQVDKEFEKERCPGREEVQGGGAEQDNSTDLKKTERGDCIKRDV